VIRAKRADPTTRQKRQFCHARTVVFHQKTVVFVASGDSDKRGQNGYPVTMGKVCRVIVFGDTLVLAGIRTSISLDPSCETIACAQTAGLQELVVLRPDALLFELNAVPDEFPYALSRELPGLLLIGIDPETNRAMFWSGHEVSELTAHDLTRAIGQFGKPHTPGPPSMNIELNQDA
jgi:hypothetical protein